MATNALAVHPDIETPQKELDRVFDIFAQAAAVFSPEDAAVLNQWVEHGRQQTTLMMQAFARQVEIVNRTLQTAILLRDQRDRHAANYATLVEAVESGDDGHPLVGQLMDTFVNTDSNIIDQMERILGDVDAAAIIADMALGRGTVDAEELDRLIEVLEAKRERLLSGVM